MLTLTLVLLAARPAGPRMPDLPAAATVFATGQDAAAQGVAGRIELEFGKALKNKGVTLVDPAKVFPPPAPASSEEGDALVKTGREAYDNLDFEAGSKALADAAVFFIKNPSAANADTLSEIFLYLGASELQTGSKEAKAAAAKQFTRALQMNPGLVPDAKYFGADVLKEFAAAQKELGKKPKGTLTVESTPGGAEVEAFGLSHGSTPIANIELPAGRYLVRLTRPGYAPATVFPDIPGGGKAEIKQTLEANPSLVMVRQKAEPLIKKEVFDADALPPAAVDVATSMQGRFLVMLSVSTGKAMPHVQAQVWNVNTHERLKGLEFDVDPDGLGYQTAAEQVQTFFSKPTAVAATVAPVADEDQPVKPSGGDGVLKQWWFWTAVGVVAVGGGVTAGVVASQPSGSRGFNVVLGQP